MIRKKNIVLSALIISIMLMTGLLSGCGLTGHSYGKLLTGKWFINLTASNWSEYIGEEVGLPYCIIEFCEDGTIKNDETWFPFTEWTEEGDGITVQGLGTCVFNVIVNDKTHVTLRGYVDEDTYYDVVLEKDTVSEVLPEIKELIMTTSVSDFDAFVKKHMNGATVSELKEYLSEDENGYYYWDQAGQKPIITIDGNGFNWICVSPDEESPENVQYMAFISPSLSEEDIENYEKLMLDIYGNDLDYDPDVVAYDGSVWNYCTWINVGSLYECEDDSGMYYMLLQLHN